MCSTNKLNKIKMNILTHNGQCHDLDSGLLPEFIFISINLNHTLITFTIIIFLVKLLNSLDPQNLGQKILIPSSAFWGRLDCSWAWYVKLHSCIVKFCRRKIIEYKVRPSNLNCRCYCLCLYCGFNNTPMNGTHVDPGNLSQLLRKKDCFIQRYY